MSPRSVSAAMGKSRVLSKDVAQRLLDLGYHRMHQSGFQKIATTLGASGPNLLHPHFTVSPLTSASLLASTIRHGILRNLEHVTAPVIRRTLDLTSERHPVWRHSSDQTARRIQCEQAARWMEDRLTWLQLKSQFEPSNQQVVEEAESLRDTLRKTRLVLDNLSEVVVGSLHPSSLHQGANAFLTPGELAQLPSPSAALRGILIRIKGPRRGTRCMTWQKSAGRISINSIDYVTAEEAKVPIPSKLGIFGLTVRLVYGRSNRLLNSSLPLSILDRHEFTLTGPERFFL